MTTIKSARSIFMTYPYMKDATQQYVPLQEHEALKDILQRWVDKANDGLIDDTFNGVRSPELTQLIADTEAQLGTLGNQD